MAEIRFKQARTPEEIEKIHRLNHRIFAEEVGQHDTTPDGRLVDHFHDQNRYFIAEKGETLAGMISVHGGPDFSIAKRLKNPSVLHQLRAPLEVRLLAILPEFRNRLVLAGLFWQVLEFARDNRYSDLLISGIVERLPMYTKIGFEPMGPPVPDGAAAFVPMSVSVESASAEQRARRRLYASRWKRTHAKSLMPGPVERSERVIAAFHAPPISHRSTSFLAIFEETRTRLSELMGGMQCIVLPGSGTLANDAVAANLYAAFGTWQGLVLANGEFGERLLRHASCAGLHFDALRFKWGDPWSFAEIESAVSRQPAWIWAVHLETSTGVLNDLARLAGLAQQHCIPVAADCVSSLGAVDIGFSDARHNEGIFLATGVSGKALGAYSGLAFAFLSEQAAEQLRGRTVCPTFDLLEAARNAGPLSTISSPPLLAVCEALRQNYSDAAARKKRYAHLDELGRWVRVQIRQAGLAPLATEEISAPTITTFPLPSSAFPRQCMRAGFKIAHESDYLRSRSWGQIATMGALCRAELESLFESLRPQSNHRAAER